MKILVKIEHLKESEIDKMKHQYTEFIHMCGLDEILFEKMVTPRFSDLWVIVEKLLLFLYGQASVKIGFSINRNIEETNLTAESFIAQWRICDFVYSVGGLFNVNINKLMAASSAYSEYKIH